MTKVSLGWMQRYTKSVTPPVLWLKKALQQHMNLALYERGFVVVVPHFDPQSDPEPRDYSKQDPTTVPTGPFRRVAADGTFELLNVLSPRQWPAFRLEFGSVPKEGVVHRAGRIPQEHVLVEWLNPYWMLCESARRPWFQARRWPWQKTTENDQVQLVKSVIEFLPEMEEVLGGGSPGPHVQRVDHRGY